MKKLAICIISLLILSFGFAEDFQGFDFRVDQTISDVVEHYMEIGYSSSLEKNDVVFKPKNYSYCGIPVQSITLTGNKDSDLVQSQTFVFEPTFGNYNTFLTFGTYFHKFSDNVLFENESENDEYYYQLYCTSNGFLIELTTYGDKNSYRMQLKWTRIPSEYLN